MNNRTEKPRPSGVSRRTVVKGAAWAVPAITVASAVPAMAASKPDIEISTVYESCKHSGEGNNSYPKGYHIGFTFRNTSTVPVTFTLPGLVTIAGDPASSQTNCVPTSGDPAAGAPLTITVPANSPAYHVVVHYYSNNSANGKILFTYTYTSSLGSGSLNFSFALSGDTCQSKGISNNHTCNTSGTGTVADPDCIAMPAGACPVP